MIFSRTYRYNSQMPVDDIKHRLVGNHVKIHNLDFEVSEQDKHLRIIPHAEQVTQIKTLPITRVKFKGEGNKTEVVIHSNMRRYDAGGPTILVAFCVFMLLGAGLFYLFGGKEYSYLMYLMGGISVAILAIFWVRMETGYFDYVRKVRDHVKNSLA